MQPDLAYCVQWTTTRLGTTYTDSEGAGQHPAKDYSVDKLAVMARRAACKRKRDTGTKWHWRILATKDLRTWQSTGMESSGYPHA